MPELTGGLGRYQQAYRNVAYRTLSDLWVGRTVRSYYQTSDCPTDPSVIPLPQRQPIPAPRGGQAIEVEGIACVVVFADEETVFVSPLGVPKYFGVARRWIAGRWKEREVVHA